ncbi:MAG TPA: hypothetical protein VIP10_11620, partial [Burkholderiaceae bacterium]
MANPAEEPETNRRTRRPHHLWIIAAAWTLAIAALTWSWLQHRLAQHRDSTAATAAVRLAGVKDTLAITFR